MDSQGPDHQDLGNMTDPQAAPGTTPVTSDPGPGQAAAPTTQQGQAQAPATAEDTFFDPTNLPPELMPGYKQMQAAFTKKMQSFSSQKQKIEAFDRFERDPQFQMQVLQNLARQHGYSITKAQARQMANEINNQPYADTPQDWQPQTWDEVLNRAEERAEQRVLQRLAPWLNTVQNVQAKNIEAQLDSIDPQWRVYEDKMQAELQAHPTLVNDVAKLYKLSVPDEVWQGRATQQAIKRLEDKAKAAQVGDKSMTSRSQPAPRKASSFQEAVDIAKEQLAKGR